MDDLYTSRMTSGKRLGSVGALFAFALVVAPRPVAARVSDSTHIGYSAAQCPSCAEWNVPQAPLRLFGNVYYVGTHGLSAILLTSPDGHVLIDGGLPESAPLIARNIRTLGFR